MSFFLAIDIGIALTYFVLSAVLILMANIVPTVLAVSYSGMIAKIKTLILFLTIAFFCLIHMYGLFLY